MLQLLVVIHLLVMEDLLELMVVVVEAVDARTPVLLLVLVATVAMLVLVVVEVEKETPAMEVLVELELMVIRIFMSFLLNPLTLECPEGKVEGAVEAVVLALIQEVMEVLVVLVELEPLGLTPLWQVWATEQVETEELVQLEELVNSTVPVGLAVLAASAATEVERLGFV